MTWVKRISFYTFGCRLNQAETAVIQNSFEKDGYRVVGFDEPADVVVVNTCTVTENGDADTRRLVNKINRLNPEARIALVGCQAQIQKDKLTELPNVRWVVGNARKFDLAAILTDSPAPLRTQVIAPTIPRDNFTLPLPAVDRRHTRANMKIQDGCDFFCSFCEIPYARGRARSRRFDDILKEARALAAAGHKEIILTGINIGTYRADEKEFLDVITALETMAGIERIRISSIEPTTIPRELFEKMRDNNSKLCRHLHIPLQSGNDDILIRMKRKYTIRDFADFIREVYRQVPQICIGTDIIVGFPGETAEQFEGTLTLLRELPFAYLHVFSYSQRMLAKSQDLDGTVPTAVIQERSRILRELSVRKRRVFYETFLGSRQEVLFEKGKGRVWKGLTDHYVRVAVESKESLENQIRTVWLEKICDQKILGHLEDDE
jgi:threonylcarbamoyladenosine tRNA methylthiotransferase MtaB